MAGTGAIPVSMTATPILLPVSPFDHKLLAPTTSGKTPDASRGGSGSLWNFTPGSPPTQITPALDRTAETAVRATHPVEVLNNGRSRSIRPPTPTMAA